MEWWYNAIPDAVYDTGDDDFFSWKDYVNKSENQKYKEDRILPFADYRENGALDPNHPATAKEVLEDGLLGDIQYNGNFSRQDAPAITVVQNKEGEPVVLRTEDTEYIEAVQSIVVNGNWQALSKDKYSIDKEAGTITIEADVFKAGEEYKLTVDATGYKSQSIAFTYDKVLENDLSLTVDYADDKEAFAAEKKEDSNKTYYFADAEFTVNGSKGDFLKNLKSVTLLSDEEDAVERNIYTKGVSSSNDVYYEVSGDGKKLILHQVQPGSYKLTLRSNYYTEALRCEFVVEKEEEEIKEEMAAPEVVEFSKHKASWSFDPDFGRASFKASKGTSVKDYLAKITSVKVGTTEYTKASYSLSSYKPTWKMSDADDPDNNVQNFDCIDFTLDGFSTEESTDVTIQAEGYEELTFTVTKDMKLAGDEEKLLPAPELTGSTTVDEGDPLVLTGDEEYLKAIKSVKVTGNNEEDVALGFAVNGTTLTIQTSALDSGLNEVVIEAKGYKNQSITVTVESQKADTEIEVSSVVKERSWTGDYYLLIRFNGVEGEKLKTFLKEIDLVEVNRKEYSKASVSSLLRSGEFAPHATDTSYSNDNYDCLKVSASGLSEEENNEILIYTKNNGTIECKLDKNWKLIKESKTLLADEVLPSEIVTTPTEGVTTPEQTPEEPKTNDENKADVPDGDKKNETDDANKAPEVDEDKKEDSDESKDTSDEKKDETSDKGDADKDDSKDESGETGDDSKKNETDESKDNDSKKDETGDVKDDTSDKEESDGGKGDASEKEESVSEEE